MTEQEIVELIEERKRDCASSYGKGDNYPSDEIVWELDYILRKITSETKQEQAAQRANKAQGLVQKLLRLIEMPKGYRLVAQVIIVGDLNQLSNDSTN